MIWALILLAVTNAVAWALVWIAFQRAELAHWFSVHQRDEEHTSALWVVSNHVKADALDAAADAWSTVEEQGNRKTLSWQHQDKPVVVSWLRARAEALRGVSGNSEGTDD